MKLPVALARTLARFDALTMRERALVAGAGAIGMVLLWVALVFDPMSVKQRTLSAELTTLQQSIQLTTLSIQETADADPTLIAQREETKLMTQLATINAQLAAKSAGLIPPERMVQVIHDVLSRQHGVRLVSLHNSPVTTLVPLAMVVLVVAAVPVNLAGWGPREGMAAWVFAGAGLGAGTGVATAVAYGAIVLVANLPGVVVLARGAGKPAASYVPRGE